MTLKRVDGCEYFLTTLTTCKENNVAVYCFVMVSDNVKNCRDSIHYVTILRD